MGGGHISPVWDASRMHALRPVLLTAICSRHWKKAAGCMPALYHAGACTPLPGASTGRKPPGICSLRLPRQRAWPGCSPLPDASFLYDSLEATADGTPRYC